MQTWVVLCGRLNLACFVDMQLRGHKLRGVDMQRRPLAFTSGRAFPAFVFAFTMYTYLS